MVKFFFVKRKGAKFFNSFAFLRREKIEDFQQGSEFYFVFLYALFNFIGDKILAS